MPSAKSGNNPELDPDYDPELDAELDQEIDQELDQDFDPEFDREFDEQPGEDPEFEATGAASSSAIDGEVEATVQKQPRGFNRWRRNRPFAAGLFIILSGIIMIVPAYLSFEVSNIVIQISTISGVSTLLIGALLITAGLMTWFKPDTQLLTGVAALILGIVALPMSNIGGFVIGTLCAIIGGSLALSWTELEKEPKRLKKQRKNEKRLKKDQGRIDEQAA